MFNLLRYVVLNDLRAKPLRVAMTATGVALGTALFISIEAINRSTLDAYSESVRSVSGKTSLVVFGDAMGFSEDLVERARSVPGVTLAAPQLLSRARFVSSQTGSDQDVSLVVLGVDLLDGDSVWRQGEGTRGSQGKLVDNALSFINRPDSVLIPRAFADRYQLQHGSPMDLVTVEGRRRFTVRGILPDKGPAQAYGGAVAVMDIDAARRAFGKEGKVDRILVVVEDESATETVAARLRKHLGPGYRVERPEGQAESFRRTLRPFQLMLALFSALALLVGLFQVASSVGVSVSEREKEIRILRALGAGKKMILAVFLFEAGAIGALGAIIGSVIGRIGASHLAQAMSQAITAQSRGEFGVGGNFSFGVGTFVSAVLVGTLASVAAGTRPALRAMSTAPLERLERDPGPVGDGFGLKTHWRLIVGLGFLALTGILSIVGGSRGSITEWFVVVAPAFGILGAPLFGAEAAVFVVRRQVSRCRGWMGALTLLAIGELDRDPRRVRSSVSSLMVGLMLVTIFSTITASFKRTLLGSYGRAVRPDLLVSSSDDLSDDRMPPLAESVGRELAEIPGVSGAYAMRKVRVDCEGKRVTLKAFDEPDPAIRYGIYDMLDRPAAEAGHELYHSKDPTVFVSETFSVLFGKKTGDRIEVKTPDGIIAMRIVGVDSVPAASGGVITMSRERYKRYWGDSLVAMFAVQLRPGVDPQQVKAVIDRGVGKRWGLSVLSQGEVKERIEQAIDRGFRSTRAIEVAALVIGFVGLFNAFAVEVMRRRREMAMLRAVGMSREQLRGMIARESVAIGALAAIPSILFGSGISYLWITRSMSAGLGWVVELSLAWKWVLATALLGIAVAWAASLIPAVRASRVEIAEGLGYE